MLRFMLSKFTDRELTVQEQILLERFRAGSYEALVCLMELRLLDTRLNLRALPFTELLVLQTEMFKTAESNPVNIGKPHDDDFFKSNDLIG